MMTFQMKLVILLAFVVVVACETCKYLKFSPLHSYCLPPNPNCKRLDKDLKLRDKFRIVKLHNIYRAVVAIGAEKNGVHLPTAANMMQMFWDKELAAVAQKYADQCKFQHDCNECRKVERFNVGQNIYTRSDSSLPTQTNWREVIRSFFDEILTFNKSDINPYVFGSYGHFTQVVWANTWRVGCGRAVYQEGQWYKTIIVCNYGPGGNIIGGEMYKEGPPCSACPKDTCCGKSCHRPRAFKGLCRPIHPRSFKI